MRGILITVTAVFVLSGIRPSTVVAQSLWFDRTYDKAISVEFLKADWNNPLRNSSILTSTVFLSLRWPLSRSLIFFSEIPFAHGDANVDLERVSETKVGNPYFGLEIGKKHASVFGEIGLRLPLASSEIEPNGEWRRGTFFTLASYVGLFSDFSRFEAFLHHVLPIVARISYQFEHPSGFSLRLRTGPVFLLNYNTNGALVDRDNRVLLDYTAQVWYSRSLLRLGFALVTRVGAKTSVSLDTVIFGRVEFMADFDLGSVRPSVYYQLPFDGTVIFYEKALNWALGVNLAVKL
ncbi:MAG: hypothetical protein ACE5HO_18055 [bacterium]